MFQRCVSHVSPEHINQGIEHVLSPTNSIAIIGPDYSHNSRVLAQVTSRLTIIEDYLSL